MVDEKTKEEAKNFLDSLNQDVDNFPEKVRPGQYLHIAATSHLVRLTGLTRAEVKPIMAEWIESQQ